jgi:putative endonuclease
MKESWFVYLLQCKDNSYYTGITNDLEKRMQKHILGTGSKYVKIKGFKKLLSSMKLKDKSQASKLEAFIKNLKRTEKLKFFQENKF